jgi:hypothetical protein
MHAARIQLDDAVCVRQSTVADARVFRIELDDVDAGDERVENIGAGGHSGERLLDRRLRTAVAEAVSIRRPDDHRLDAASADDGSLTEQWTNEPE